MNTEIGDNFWLYDIEILWKNNNFIKLYPSNNMTKYEKFNAFSRLLILHMIIILILNLDKKYIYIDLFLLLITIAINFKHIENKNQQSSINNPYINLNPYYSYENLNNVDKYNNMFNNFMYNSNYNSYDIINENY
jgi:hypothetical protein